MTEAELKASIEAKLVEILGDTQALPAGAEDGLLARMAAGVGAIIDANLRQGVWRVAELVPAASMLDPEARHQRRLDFDIRIELDRGDKLAEKEKEHERFFMFKALDNMGLTTEERLYLCGDATYNDSWRDVVHRP